jgi:phosphatidylinositol alpha-1,6-mannosyltransferase
MKILFFTESLNEKVGWGRYSINLIRALVDTGVEADVVCGAGGLNLPEVKKFPLIFVTGNRLNLLLAPVWAWFWAIVIWLGLRLRGLNSKDYDIFYCLVEPYLPVVERLARLSGRPYVGTICGTFGVKPFESARHGSVFKQALKQAAAITCLSEYTKSRVGEFVDVSQFRVIGPGIETSQVTSASPEEINQRQPTLLSVGALKERKGQHLVLLALATLRQRFPDLRLVLVYGDSKQAYKEKLLKIIQDHQLDGCVEFREKISDSDLDQLYKEAKIFVLTPVSQGSDFEGYGLVYLEANLRAVPAIGSVGNGGEDAVIPQQSGLLVPASDVSAIAEAISYLLSLDPQAYLKLASAAEAWALANDTKILAQTYLEVLSQVLAKVN